VSRSGSAMIRQATAGDHSALLSLLADAGLPTEGVPASLDGFVVAEAVDGSVVGAAGIEAYGDKGLLRSVVVAPSLRGTGLGQDLTEHVMAEAGERGIADLYLLTTTAERFFPRFGFYPVTRDAVPDAVQASVEFQGACPSTAVIMHCPVPG
jgi:amino-acid N-acetyltransferase